MSDEVEAWFVSWSIPAAARSELREIIAANYDEMQTWPEASGVLPDGMEVVEVPPDQITYWDAATGGNQIRLADGLGPAGVGNVFMEMPNV